MNYGMESLNIYVVQQESSMQPAKPEVLKWCTKILFIKNTYADS